MRFFLFLLLVICLVGIGLFSYSYHRLYKVLHTQISAKEFVFPEGLATETNFVETKDHHRIAYWHFPAEEPKAGVILVHGYKNPGGKSLMLPHVKYLHDHGYSTILVDLRAHGESSGEKISLGTQEWQDAEAIYDQVKQLPELIDKKIGFLGISMGASTALVTTGITNKGDFVIASVPYSDFSALFSPQIKNAGFPPSVFLPFLKTAAMIELGQDYENFTPLSVVEKITVPMLFMQATQDTVVDPAGVEKLFERANEPKELWQADSPHDIFHYHPEEFQEKVLNFLEKNVN